MAASSGPDSAVSSTTVQVSNLVSAAPGLFQAGASLATVATGVGGKGQQFLIVNQGPSLHSSGGGIQIVTSNKQEREDAVKRREILARQPSYCKILNDLKEAETSETETEVNDKQPLVGLVMKGESEPGPSPADTTQTVVINGQHYQIVSPGAAGVTGLLGDSGLLSAASPGSQAGQQQPLSPQGSPVQLQQPAYTGGTQQQQAERQQQTVFIPASTAGTTQVVTVAGGTVSNGSVSQSAEEQARKREIRLMKNREAARECRNKKKEYIKCLENRVAVLENQNKALIEELKSLKELYTGQKN